MAYVRKKRVRNKKTGKVYEYNQLVEGVWQPDGKVKQVVLAHLGGHETLEEAIEEAQLKEREHSEADRWSKVYEDFHGRYGELIRQFPDRPVMWPGVPTIEDVVKRAYPQGWEPGSGKGRKWRKAFSLPEDPGENPTLKDFGEFMVELKKFWREFNRFFGERERVRDRQHLAHVKHYLETRAELESKGDSRPEAHQRAANIAFKAIPELPGSYNALDAALLERLDKVFSHKV